MKGNIFKIAILIITALSPINGTLLNACLLKYQKKVPNKPDLFVVAAGIPGICRIRDDDIEVQNYHWQNVSTQESFSPFNGIIGFGRPYIPEIYKGVMLLSAHQDMALVDARGLNYDAHSGTLLYLSNVAAVPMYAKLNKLRLEDRKLEVILDQRRSTTDHGPHPPIYDHIADLTYDWISKNVYLKLNHVIYAINVDNPRNFTDVVTNKSGIRSLAVHPNEGYLFFLDTISKKNELISSSIYRSHLDGMNATEIIRRTGDEAYITNLAIDFYNDRLYWCMPNKERIEHSKLDGSDIRIISERRVYTGLYSEASRSLAFDKDYVYYRPGKSNSVRRFRKVDQIEDEDFEVVTRKELGIIEIVVYSAETQKVREDHPCRYGNGGCDEFCFAVPKNNKLSRVCGCSNGKILTRDVFCEAHI